MSVKSCDDKIYFNYISDDSIEEIKKYLDDTSVELHYKFHGVQFDISMITASVCDSVEYVLSKIPKFDEVKFRTGYYDFIQTDDSIIRLLNMLNPINSVILTVRRFSGNHFALRDEINNLVDFVSDLIKILLYNINAKKMLIEEYKLLDSKWLQIIENNNNIKHVHIDFTTDELIRLTEHFTPTGYQKINKVSVVGCRRVITSTHIKNMITFAPNLENIRFNCYRDSDKIYQSDEAINEIVDYIKTAKCFNKLYFECYNLHDNSIKYMCEQFSFDTHIRSIKFKDCYRYGDDIIHAVTNMIKNNIHLTKIHIERIGSTNALFEIVRSLSGSNIKTLILEVKFGRFDKYKQVKNTILQILSENYSLTKIDITCSISFETYKLDMSSITNRNIDLAKESC